MKFETSCFAVIALFGSFCSAELTQIGLKQAPLVPRTGPNDPKSLSDFNAKCRRNGGTPVLNFCVCPSYYRGEECEIKMCMNDGELETVIPKTYETTQTVQQVCKCPNPEYITGEYCEDVRCANRGILDKDLYSWECKCRSSSHEGKFCEKFDKDTSRILVVFCLFTTVAAVVFWCHRCRKNPRNEFPPSGNQQQLVSSEDARSRREPSQNPRPAHRASSSSADLISTEQPMTTNYASVQIDTFEQTRPGGLPMPVGPPPSYNHAVLEIRADPPSYTQTAVVKSDS